MATDWQSSAWRRWRSSTNTGYSRPASTRAPHRPAAPASEPNDIPVNDRYGHLLSVLQGAERAHVAKPGLRGRQGASPGRTARLRFRRSSPLLAARSTGVGGATSDEGGAGVRRPGVRRRITPVAVAASARPLCLATGSAVSATSVGSPGKRAYFRMARIRHSGLALSLVVRSRRAAGWRPGCRNHRRGTTPGWPASWVLPCSSAAAPTRSERRLLGEKAVGTQRTPFRPTLGSEPCFRSTLVSPSPTRAIDGGLCGNRLVWFSFCP
jgi:hypothetical protein